MKRQNFEISWLISRQKVERSRYALFEHLTNNQTHLKQKALGRNNFEDCKSRLSLKIVNEIEA